MLKQKFPQAGWRVLDHYDPAIMTEASIRRARKLFPPTAGTIAAIFVRWPLADASQDVVFGMLAIHELVVLAARGGCAGLALSRVVAQDRCGGRAAP
jgi:hypothetical protein